ncbi:MAG: DUF1559 domain-containing protein, partial [Planctomycetales bacterium]|nr:DUF1559 domain-containing protein [Planctomycetales bacterium]
QSLQCPAATLGAPMTGAYGYSGSLLTKGHYAACWGAGTYSTTNSELDGTFGEVVLSKTTTVKTDTAFKGRWKMGAGKGTNISALQKDGTSKTMVVSEVRASNSSADTRGVWLFGGMGGASFTAKYTPNSVQKDFVPGCTSTVDMPCDPLGSSDNDGVAWATARSEHSSGVVVGFGDGHAKFISENIEAAVWSALATKQGPTTEPEIPADL